MAYPTSLIGTLVFPGRQSVLSAWTVPEYAAVAYPVLNYSSSAHQMVNALGDNNLGKYLNFANYKTTANTTAASTTSNTTASTAASTTSTAGSTSTSSANNDLSRFNPLPISDLYGNAIPYNNAVVQQGLFGNVHGVNSILSRYVGDLMPTDKDSPGYTWKYTLPWGNSGSTSGSASTAASTTASTDSTAASTTSTTGSTSTSGANNDLSKFNPLPISDLYGGAIPYNNAVVQQGLFGNVHGVNSILSRYVGDLMPTDKDSPGYTWKYTLPNYYF